ncbi:olfactory receptor 14C36-like [Passer domesticus]|uniref:olfactory receptor 14C36-like n=1 Tax=Passer domesticus TaxID=48849 RepID=UPI0030FEE2AE
MHNSLWDTTTISYPGCAAQLFLLLLFMGAEYFLLTIMCYDRYVSICKPLHYGILKLSCSKYHFREYGLIAVSACLLFGCFVFIVFSYVQIFRAVLRIPSEHGRHKVFSTCLPHLAVISLFVITSPIHHLMPPFISSQSLDLALSLLYSLVPPALNPLIYSLRNQELKTEVRRLMTGCFQKH